MTFAWGALLAAFAGATACRRETEPAPAKRDPVTNPIAVDASVTPRREVTVRWANVSRADDCFFFSGPEGRDDQVGGEVHVETVEREGEHLQLRIGTAVFEGTYARGALSLARTSKHDFHGPWTATETLDGRQQGDQLTAHYVYEECELASKACPGRCTITGDLVFSRGL